MDRFTGRMLLPWLRFSWRPGDIAQQLARSPAPVCYVLARESTLDQMVLQRACAGAKLPRPGKRLLAKGMPAGDRSLLLLARKVGFWRQRLDRRTPPLLRSLLAELKRDPDFDVTLVPVAIYWGRAPQRESGSFLSLMLSEDWALSSRLRRALTVTLNGRDTLVEFGQGVSLRSLRGEDMRDNQASRRISRHLMAQLAASRAAYMGPDLSHRRTLMTQVLRTRAVRQLIGQEARERGISRRAALESAQGMFEEIAADYSHAFVRVMERVLRWLLLRIFDGVEVANAATLAEVASGNEIIYVPCHRSTMDDLLMPFAVYKQGFAVPHIAAGINLNLPVVGPMLRKGGAFFMRRSFRGSPLYTAVFMNYLGAMMARGHALQYFIEGGRSRTGRSLQPKTGMLTMTLRSYLRQPVRPVVFVPVYIGYERIMEIDSYVAELSGKPKEKETLLGFLRSLRRLRENFGRVHVNIGEPIALGPLLDEHQPGWRDRLGQDGKAAVSAASDALAQRIMRNIHAAAAVTPVNLLAMVLLASERQLMPEADLVAQLDFYLGLLRSVPYSDRVSVTDLSAAGIIANGEKLGILQRSPATMVGVTPRLARAIAYYRNNVLHLFALPSLLAGCLLSNGKLPREDIHRLASSVYPYIASELFLRSEEPGLAAAVDGNLQYLIDGGLVPARLSLLAQPMLQTLERYYLAIAMLLRAGSGVLTQQELEKSCQRMAGRINAASASLASELPDRSLFETFITQLRRRGMIRADAGGRLIFDDALERIAADVQRVLSDQARHGILQVIDGGGGKFQSQP
jgi:glycerol-3-phosphate O-acyltransferase